MKRPRTIVLIFSLLGVASLAAQEPLPAPSITAAEKAYSAGNWLEAERQFAALLKAGATDHALCCDRLLAIYFRLDRHVAAIDLGLRYRQSLLKAANYDRLRSLHLELGRFYLMLGHRTEAEDYLRQAETEPRGAPLAPIAQAAVLELSALCAAARKDQAKAQGYWRKLEQTAAALIDAPKTIVSDDDRIDLTWKLAQCLGQQDKSAAAIERLLTLVPLHDKLKDIRGKRDTLRQLGEHSVAQKDYPRAEQYYRDALPDQPKQSEDLLAAGDVAVRLAELSETRKRFAEAERWRKEAAAHYQAVVEKGGPATMTVFWKLHALHRKSNQIDQALQLAAPQAWSVDLLVRARWKAEQGNLEATRGVYAKARPLLREAVKDLEGQTPLNLNLLPRALANLAGVELLMDDWVLAKKLARRCQDLLDRFEIADDLVQIEVHNVLGVCSAQEGKYAEAIDRFRAGLAQCDGVGEAAEHLRCHLLLNLALVHKSQGDLGQASQFCEDALVVYQRFADPDALGLAAFYAAQTGILVAQKNIAEAAERSAAILALCRKHKIDQGPLVVTARHAQALHHLHRLDFDAAEQAWRQVLALQEKEKQAVLLPRTLNYLALTAEFRGQKQPAEELYRRALKVQQELRAYPATHFITLWRLAHLLRERGQVKEARLLLEDASALAEKTRLQTFGDAQQRAEFLGQFAPGFDDLVGLHVQEGNAEAALIASSRSRSRGLLDHLQMAGVDPRSALSGPKGKALIEREEAIKTEIAGLRARAVLVSTEDAGTPQAMQLIADFDKAQARYAEVWREILNASTLYRPLVDSVAAERVLDRLRAKVIGPKTLLLSYHIGGEHSWAFLVGPEKTEVFALTLGKHVAERIGAPKALQAAQTEAVLSGRGVELVAGKQGQGMPTDEPDLDDPPTPLGQFAARALVDHYVQLIASPNFAPRFGFTLTPLKAKRPVATQRLELVAKVFLPAALRRRIHEIAPAHLIVIPDGPLHKLPLEALLLQSGARPLYVLDELPPIVYAPSAAALVLLSERAPVKRRGNLSLLTVGNPAFASAPEGKSARHSPLAHLQNQLPLLKGTALESAGIRQCFDPRDVVALEGKQATEKAVVAAMPGRNLVHLATHGFADTRFGNLFGALAFAPSQGPPSAEDDGLLTLHEIYALPLGDCELAVLSACATHVGPQAPLEAGVTLGNGFLAAGARRVIASHWPVEDQSTAKLMEGFFQEIAKAAQSDQPLACARALHRARVNLRQNRPAPFYWAPFVLIGAAD